MKLVLSATGMSKSENPVPVFHYRGVDFTPAQIEALKAAKGENFRLDEKSGQPVISTTKFAGKSANMIQTSNGNFMIDRTDARILESYIKQYGAETGRILYEEYKEASRFVNTPAAPAAESNLGEH